MRAALALACVVLAACGPNRTFPERAAYQPAASQALPCVPNLDGQIDAAELLVATGVTESLLVNPVTEKRTVDVAGKIDAAGKRVWDLSTDYASDQVAKVTATTLAGKWYAGSFAAGQFVTPLDTGGAIEGVYSRDASTVFLLGYASVKETPADGKTLVVYTQPVALYRFPLTPGKQWVSVGEVRNATVHGLPYAGRDTYSISLDAAGELVLPDFTFTQALRSRTHLAIEPAAGVSVTRRQVSWLFECFGEVARATSQDNETQDDFTTTTELRRLGY